jgi:hypothetical protein
MQQFAYCGSTTSLKRHLETSYTAVMRVIPPAAIELKKVVQSTLSFRSQPFIDARPEATSLYIQLIVANMLPLHVDRRRRSIQGIFVIPGTEA